MRCEHGIATGGSSVAHCEYCDKQSLLYLSKNLDVSRPVTISIVVHDQEPMIALISCISDLVNDAQFDILGDIGRDKALRFALAMSGYEEA